jgi:hypothetical protein
MLWIAWEKELLLAVSLEKRPGKVRIPPGGAAYVVWAGEFKTMSRKGAEAAKKTTGVIPLQSTAVGRRSQVPTTLHSRFLAEGLSRKEELGLEGATMPQPGC